MALLLKREEERNVLGAADRHCAQCVECSDRGWVVIGTLPQPGSRTCMSNCKCRMEYRTMPALGVAA
jgi:hypothetical protein